MNINTLFFITLAALLAYLGLLAVYTWRRRLLRPAAAIRWMVHITGGRALTLEHRLDFRRLADMYPRGRLALELALLVAVGLSFARLIANPDPGLRPPGLEHERLSGVIIPAELGLRQFGRIPLWNPYIYTGEPLISNPFNYLFNPFASLPLILFGAVQGTKLAIVLTLLIAGLGQWSFARVLGMGTPARLTAAMLYMCSGQIVGKFNGGHFQLGVSLAWPPWVLVGVWLSMTTRKRWPKALASLAFAMLFFSGNIYYSMHTLIAAALIAAFLALRQKRRINWPGLRGAALAGLFALGLSMMQFLPVWAARDYINHPADFRMVSQHPLHVIAANYLQPHPDWFALVEPYTLYTTVDYAYIGPLALLAPLGLIPVFWRRRRSPIDRRAPLIALTGMLVVLGWTVTGAFPLINHLYQSVPLLARFRFVGRAGAFGDLWLALLAGLGVEALWHLSGWARRWLRAQRRGTSAQMAAGWRAWGDIVGGGLRATLLALLVWGIADVHQANYQLLTPIPTQPAEAQTVYRTLDARTPEPDYFTLGSAQDAYNAYYAQIKNLKLTEGWRPGALPSDFGLPWLMTIVPRYEVYMALGSRKPDNLGEDDSLTLLGVYGTGYRQYEMYEADAPTPYAFLAKRDVLARARRDQPLRADDVQPVEVVAHEIDHITVRATSLQPGLEVLVVLETNFPGWHVRMDGGPPRELVNVYTYIGVEPEFGQHTYTFWFHPPEFDTGLLITGAALALMGVYLMLGGKS